MNRHLALDSCLRMISAQTLRVCSEGKPLYTFPDHAPEVLQSRAGFMPVGHCATFGRSVFERRTGIA
jgi:hypothetical protein